MTRERLCEWETRRLGDWEDGMTRRPEEFVSGGRGDWETRRLGDCETGRKKMNSLTYLLTFNFKFFNFLPLLITHYSSTITHHSSLIIHHSSLITHLSSPITHHSSTPKLFNYSTIIICPQ